MLRIWSPRTLWGYLCKRCEKSDKRHLTNCCGVLAKPFDIWYAIPATSKSLNRLLNMGAVTKETITIASDHAGFELKQILTAYLRDIGHRVFDLGTDSTESVDYPDFAHKLAQDIKCGRSKKGVLVCGSGIGISIAANRHPDIRAALVHDTLSAKMCRQHNDANVIAFGGRVIEEKVAVDCLKTFLNTEFEV